MNRDRRTFLQATGAAVALTATRARRHAGAQHAAVGEMIRRDYRDHWGTPQGV